jgi:hypothetical protein
MKNGATNRDLLVPVQKHVVRAEAPLPLSLTLYILPDDADMDTLDLLAYVYPIFHSAIVHETLLEIAPLLEIHTAPGRTHTQRQIIAKEHWRR